jgi:hypothetical protein
LVGRTNRILEDYRELKTEEASGRLELLRRSSTISGMGVRSGSWNHLLPVVLTPPLEGPVEQVEWFSRENAREHRTDRYEVVSNPKKLYPVYRRGQGFFMAVKMVTKSLDLSRQPLLVYFTFGETYIILEDNHLV